MPAVPLFELEARAREDLRIEVAAIVDHDHDRGPLPQETSRGGARGKSRSKWVVRRAERAARASTMRSTSACSYSSQSSRNASNSDAARGAYQSRRYLLGRNVDSPSREHASRSSRSST